MQSTCELRKAWLGNAIKNIGDIMKFNAEKDEQQPTAHITSLTDEIFGFPLIST